MTALLSKPPTVQHGGTLFSKLFQKVTFETHVWPGIRQSKIVDVTIDGKKVDSGRVGKPRVSLYPDDLGAKVQDARQRVYGVLARHTISVDTNGARVLAVRNAPAFVSEFNDATATFNAVADEVVARYDEIREYNRKYWTETFGWDDTTYGKHIGCLIPSQGRLRKMFQVTYYLDTPDAAMAARFEDPAVAEFFEEAAAQAESRKEAMIETLVKEPVAKLADALLQLKQQLAHGKILQPATFSGVLAAISLCKAVETAVPCAIMEQVKQLALNVDGIVDKAEQANAGGTSYTATISQFKGTLTGAIDSMIETIDDAAGAQEALISKLGKLPRALSFEEMD